MKTLADMMPTNRIASVFLHNFSGTLADLLDRIKKKQYAIAELILRELSEQVLLFCQKEESLESKADSLAITAQLILLKTKELLIQKEEAPKEKPSINDPSLIRKLMELLDQKEKLSLRKLARKFPLPVKIKEMPTVSFLDLKALFTKFLHQAKTEPVLALKKEKWSLHAVMRQLLYILEKKECSFYEIFFPIKNKSLLIFTFLALLELIKQQKITFQNKENNIYFKTHEP